VGCGAHRPAGARGPALAKDGPVFTWTIAKPLIPFLTKD